MQTLKIGDRVLEKDGTISEVLEIEGGEIYGCSTKLKPLIWTFYPFADVYWVSYYPPKLTPLLEALL
jgi:hypothetical protein